MTSKPTYGSLFSGVGGFDLGFDDAGFSCAFQVEWDPDCQQTLAYHWPNVPRWSDVQDVRGADLPDCDVLIFGAPCQDLSVVGKRAGLDGDRSSMFYEAIRIVKEMKDGATRTRPRALVWENVAGALHSNRGADFGIVLDEVAKVGAMVIEWAILDARYFGVPQRRRRIFLVALFDPDLADRSPDRLLPLAESPNRNRSTSRISDARGSGTDNEMDLVLAFDSNFGGQAQFHRDISPPLKIGTALGIASPPAITLIGEPPRKLLPVECERLQGWPDDHTLYRADGKTNRDSARYRMCGNGVATPVARWVAERLRPLFDVPTEVG